MRKVGIKRARAWNVLEKIHLPVICSLLLSVTKLHLKYYGYYINIYYKRWSKYVKKSSCFSQSWNPDAESPTSTVSFVSYSVQRYRYLSNLEFESVLCFGFLTDFTSTPLMWETFFFQVTYSLKKILPVASLSQAWTADLLSVHCMRVTFVFWFLFNAVYKLDSQKFNRTSLHDCWATLIFQYSLHFAISLSPFNKPLFCNSYWCMVFCKCLVIHIIQITLKCTRVWSGVVRFSFMGTEGVQNGTKVRSHTCKYYLSLASRWWAQVSATRAVLASCCKS